MSRHGDQRGAETIPKAGDDGNKPIVAVLIPGEMRRRILTTEAEQRLSRIAHVVSPIRPEVTPEDLGSILNRAEACLTGWGTPPLSDEMLIAHPRLGLVAHTAGSVRRLVSLSAMARGIRVSHAATVIADAVAEQVVLGALLCLRPLHKIDREMKSAGDWMDLRDRYPGRLLGSQTIGIIGAGYVGRVVIRLFKAFGCRVLVADPFLSGDQAETLGAELVDLSTLFGTVDVLSLHAPVLPETRGMVGAEQIRSLRDGGIFINAARAALVDEQALLQELKTGRITAILDVFDQEPLPRDSPFRKLPNVILSPHSAGHSIDTHQRQGDAMVDEIQRFFNQEPLQHEVSPEMFATMA